MSAFKTTEEHLVLIDRICEVIRGLAPGEALPWEQLLFVPRKRRSYWIARAAKSCGIPCDWDRTGILRVNPKDATTLRRARKHTAGLRNKARRTQQAYERAGATLDAKAPAELHKESAYGAGVAGSVFGMMNAAPAKALGNERPKLPLFTEGKSRKV